MKIKHTEVDIPEDNPFKNCKLGREKYGQILTTIIGSYSDGFVLGIDNKWGTGKTTFVKMWKQQLDNENYKTLYFNAWSNDFDSNPLIAILSELKTLNPSSDDVSFKKLLTKGAIITQNLLPAVVKAIAEKYIDIAVIKDALEEVAKSAGDILKTEIDDYSKKKKGLVDFKKDLETYVEKNTEKQPLIFIIDELDRCRPSYAVEVLEQIKHFFSVKGTVFVLAIDKIQLGNAIKGFYGSESIDSNEYLRRFIDIEYTIPPPPTGVFCQYLFDYYQFDLFFNKPARKHPELIDEKELFLNISTKIFDKDNITLRQQEKIFAHARLALNTIPEKNYLYPEMFFLLTYIRDQKSSFYLNIRNRKFKPQQFIDNLKDLLPQNLDKYDVTHFIYLEAQFAMFYDNYCKESHVPSNLYEHNPESKESVLLVNSSYGTKEANDVFLGYLTSFSTRNRSGTKLSILLDKIDLLENVIN